MPDPVLSARGRLGYAQKVGNADTIATARQELVAAKIESYIQRVVADAPPLSPAQRNRLAALFLGGAA
jgi:type IV secretory pathway TrbF-like protein